MACVAERAEPRNDPPPFNRLVPLPPLPLPVQSAAQRAEAGRVLTREVHRQRRLAASRRGRASSGSSLPASPPVPASSSSSTLAPAAPASHAVLASSRAGEPSGGASGGLLEMAADRPAVTAEKVVLRRSVSQGSSGFGGGGDGGGSGGASSRSWTQRLPSPWPRRKAIAGEPLSLSLATEATATSAIAAAARGADAAGGGGGVGGAARAGASMAALLDAVDAAPTRLHWSEAFAAPAAAERRPASPTAPAEVRDLFEWLTRVCLL